MILKTHHFLGVGAFLALAFVLGYLLQPAGRRGDTPQQRDAVALVSAHIGEAVTYYDLEWNDEPHVLSVVDRHGDTVVTEEVRIATSPYDGAPNPAHMRFVIRGVVSPKNWLRGPIKVISHERLAAPKPS